MISGQERVFSDHPCFGKKKNKGRIHLPVAPQCNISCNFCIRSLTDPAQRPGVAREILQPEQAVDAVRRAVELCPELTVVGIAGPGDPLASRHAVETFRLVKEAFPDLIRCLSTNGLMLPAFCGELKELEINSLTVTVNAVDSQLLSRICGHVIWEGKRIDGEEGARILIENQLEGIRQMAQSGAVLKVNTVLIPGVNDEHIATIAKTVGALGASTYNIIPLIPQHRFAHIQAPACSEIDAARRSAEPYINVFRHCQHCRADAVGIPGQTDYGEMIYRKRIAETFSHG